MFGENAFLQALYLRMQAVRLTTDFFIVLGLLFICLLAFFPPLVFNICFFFLQHELYLVLDTGALLTHLQALQEFRAGPIRSLGKQAVLVVPWVVLVKMSQLLKSTVPAVKKRVGKAAEFLRECISSEHPNIIFQTLDEVS